MKRVGKVVAGALLWLLLFVYFAYLRFPYDRLRPQVDRALTTLGGLEVRYGSIGPVLLGFADLRLRDVEVVFGRGDGAVTLPLARVDLDPSLLALARGAVDVDFDADTLGGGLGGSVSSSEGSPVSIEVQLDGLDLAALPLPAGAPPPQGRLDGDVTAEFRPGRIRESRGTVTLAAREGRIEPISAPGLPTAIPPRALAFDRIDAELVLEPGLQLQVRTLRLEGSDLEGEVEGTVTLRPGSYSRSRIDGKARFRLLAPELRDLAPLLEAARIRESAPGSYDLELTGTVGRPRVR